MKTMLIAKLQVMAVVVAAATLAGGPPEPLAGLFAAEAPAEAKALPADQGRTYFVSTEGNDTNPGTSPKLAWRTISHAAKKAQAGDLVRIKGGDYGFEQVMIESSGTPEAPIRFEGYDGAVKLEAKMEKRTKGKQKGKMKLAGRGVGIRGSYIKVSGITALKYGRPFGVEGHHNTLERCTAGIGGSDAIYVSGHHNEVRHCTAYNSGMSGIGVKLARDITIADCWSYCDPCLMGMYPGVDTGTDYLYGMNSGRNVRFTRCRGDGKNRSGHAMCFTAKKVGKTAPESLRCANCLVTDCEMYNCWEHFGVRQCSHDITFVNCYAEGDREPNSGDFGFYFRAGVYNILVKNCRAKRLAVGLYAYERGGGVMKRCGVTRNITFENCIATHCATGIRLDASSCRAINCLSARNEYGIEIFGTEPYVMTACKASGLSMEKIVKGCIVCENKVGIKGSSFPVTHCNVWDNKTNYAEGTKPGTGCISKDPQFVEQTGRNRNCPDYGDWHLKETSPCRDMGPYAADPKAPIGMR